MRLQSLRRMKKMSQEDLARKVGTSQTQVCRIEKGERYPSLRYILRICRALHTPPNEILFDEMIGIDMPEESPPPTGTADFTPDDAGPAGR